MNNNWKFFLVISLGLFLFSCAPAAVTPIEVKKSGDRVVIEVGGYRITEKIAGEEKAELYLVYGVAGRVGDCTAILNVMPYEKAKQLIQQYGEIGNCKSVSGQEWARSSYDIKCYASNISVEDSIKKINSLKTVPVVRIKYMELELLEWIKKQGGREIKYKSVTEKIPHYLVTSIEVLDERFDPKKKN